MQKRRIAGMEQLADGKTLAFEFVRDGIRIDAFVGSYKGKIVAYENLCRHIPIRLDYGDKRFFTPDGRHFLCQSHGALYDPENGLCVRGPCQGASLKPVLIQVENNDVWLLEGD